MRFDPGRPVVFRGASVLTVDRAGVIEGGDVLVIGDTIAEVDVGVPAPPDAVEIDAGGGILMPGMIDTHRHMWQAAIRGYAGDWALSQYFSFYYLQWGDVFRPEDIYAGNPLSALESVGTGITTTLDWSHGLRTVDHAEAAVDALRAVPGRFVLGYGNYLGAPWEWSHAPEFRSFADRTFTDDLLTLELAFDVIGDPAFPERATFEAAGELDGRVLKYDGRRIDLPLAPVRAAVDESVEHVRRTIGDAAWYDGIHPEIADIQNPYGYTDAGDARVRVAASRGERS